MCHPHGAARPYVVRAGVDDGEGAGTRRRVTGGKGNGEHRDPADKREGLHALPPKLGPSQYTRRPTAGVTRAVIEMGLATCGETATGSSVVEHALVLLGRRVHVVSPHDQDVERAGRIQVPRRGVVE